MPYIRRAGKNGRRVGLRAAEASLLRLRGGALIKGYARWSYPFICFYSTSEIDRINNLITFFPSDVGGLSF